MLPVALRLFLAGLCLVLAGCEPAQNASQAVDTTGEVEQAPGQSSVQDALDRGIAAQGGLSTWHAYHTLEYDQVQGERRIQHLIDLQTRKTRQTTKDYQLGFDGADVWVAPTLDAFPGNPRFSNGLDFYFFAIPFVLADPGTNREPLGRVTVDGTEYEAVKISYDAGVGASPDDYYIVHFDPETHRLHVLLYTVTFRSQEPNENYNARVYEEWQDVGGLVLPRKVTSYRWNSEQRRLGEKRRETIYDNVKLSTEKPDPARFSPPDVAEIDTASPNADG